MPSDTQALLDFIEAVKAQGSSDEFIVALLRQNGWSEKRIYLAFSSWYESRTGQPVPNGGGRIEAAKDAFLYLLAFITLGIWALQLGSLLFNAIDCSFPNPLFDSQSRVGALRSMADELASVIVAFPIFLLVTRWILRGIQEQPERSESPVGKWLTYIALVITASAMIGDVVTFLAYLLRGDLDIRFVLKVGTVLGVAGGILVYYLSSLNQNRRSSRRNRQFAIAASVIVLLGLVVGFVQIGSPATQRVLAEDTRRLNDLSNLAQQIHGSWLATNSQRTFILPRNIGNILKTDSGRVHTSDPVSGQLYTYEPSQGTAYRLCAVFSRSGTSGLPDQWHHSAGRVCFPLDASQDVSVVQR